MSKIVRPFFPRVQNVTGYIWRATVLALVVGAGVAGDSTLIPRDPRGIKLEAFFKTYDCPAPLHIDEYLRAADEHAIDYRVLPVISVLESTCGSYSRLNNRWGWDSARSGFSSVPEGIEFLAAQLSKSATYRNKSVDQKLYTYNPNPAYVRQAKRLMRQIEN